MGDDGGRPVSGHRILVPEQTTTPMVISRRAGTLDWMRAALEAQLPQASRRTAFTVKLALGTRRRAWLRAAQPRFKAATPGDNSVGDHEQVEARSS